MALEERLMMAADPLMPGNTVASPGQVLYYGADVPLKTITITNNTNQTVYPILEDANNRAVPGIPTLPLYDPLDNLDKDYRGYIGYTLDGVNYLGLREHTSITINVPLVFWDAGRMDIATDGAYMTPGPGKPNPFHYTAQSNRFAVPAIGGSAGGLVMWYYADLAQAPSPDAPAQLTEMTIRDPYLGTLSTGKYIPAAEKLALINYDVSYVDSMILPVAMEAYNVPVPVPNDPSPPIEPYGWVGAKYTYKAFQDELKAFTSDNPKLNGLGDYFGGKGYNQYYTPDVAATGAKLPAGQNLIANSPLNNVRSSFNQDRYMLVSGGAGNISYDTGGTSEAGTSVLSMDANQKGVLKYLEKGMVVTANTPPGGTSDIAPGTTITDVKPGLGLVYLSQPTIGSATDHVYIFTRPVTDYVATDLTSLWYGWADLYVRDHLGQSANGVGTTVTSSPTLTLTAANTAVVTGMTVTGLGIAPGTAVLAIDGPTILLSKLATSSNVDASYAFGAPPLIPRSPEVQPLQLSFTGLPNQVAADQFGGAVYSVMNAMSTVPIDPKSSATLSAQLMFNVLGTNVAKIPGITPAVGVPLISNAVRDATKSVLRGVANYVAVPETTGQWYPNPAAPTPDASVDGTPARFNLYNMNPFVWFVHKKLGLSGYGFSVDDDTADVGALGASVLQVSVGGLNGLTNKAPWTFGAPFGPVSGQGQIDVSKYPNRIFELPPLVLAKLNNADPNVGPGATVTGEGIPPNTRVVSKAENGSVILNNNLLPVPAGTYTYTFAGS